MDSKLPSLFPRRFYLDIVDDDWIADTLSDDEIDVPHGSDIAPNASDCPPGDPLANGAEAKVDQWNDLGLELWAKDSQ